MGLGGGAGEMWGPGWPPRTALALELPQVEALVKDRVGRLELKAMLVKLVFALLLLLLLGVMLLRLRLLTLLL